ncbi:MAG TPA: hypothetical protein VMG34_05360 [Bacteroidota bacterium]|nr:hypothetical protein [Bacteroidota bacterium]
MDREGVTSEFVLALDGKEQCPECGHLWNDEGTAHYHDCRYFYVDGENEEDDFFTEEVEEHSPRPSMKTAA